MSGTLLSLRSILLGAMDCIADRHVADDAGPHVAEYGLDLGAIGKPHQSPALGNLALVRQPGSLDHADDIGDIICFVTVEQRRAVVQPIQTDRFLADHQLLIEGAIKRNCSGALSPQLSKPFRRYGILRRWCPARDAQRASASADRWSGHPST